MRGVGGLGRALNRLEGSGRGEAGRVRMTWAGEGGGWGGGREGRGWECGEAPTFTARLKSLMEAKQALRLL